MEDGPIRTCVGCRRKDLQDKLIRVVASADGAVSVERRARGRRAPSTGGRGAYLCPDGACAKRALGSGAFRRALRRPVSLLDGFEDELLDEVTRRVAASAGE